MATLRAWRDTVADASSLPILKYMVELGQYIVYPVGVSVGPGIIVPIGGLLIFDYGRFWEGEVAFKPKYDDSRMRLYGSKLPPFSGDKGYMGGIKIDVMVQHHGLCSFVTTSQSVIDVIVALHDVFILAVEAREGQLPVYRIESPRSFINKHSSKTNYPSQYHPMGWGDRPATKFKPRLIPPPQLRLTSDAPALESDAVFDDITQHGEVMPAEPVPTVKSKDPRYGVGANKRSKRDTEVETGQQYDPELDDKLPF